MQDSVHHMHFTLLPEDYETLCEKAKACGLTKRAYLTRLIRGEMPKAASTKELRELTAELNKIGSNINQIARSANMHNVGPDDVVAARLLLEKAYKLLAQIKVG